MWKLFISYREGGKVTITGKGKEITPEQVKKYYDGYAIHASAAVYQRYPKKDHEPVNFFEMAAAEN